VTLTEMRAQAFSVQAEYEERRGRHSASEAKARLASVFSYAAVASLCGLATGCGGALGEATHARQPATASSGWSAMANRICLADAKRLRAYSPPRSRIDHIRQLRWLIRLSNSEDEKFLARQRRRLSVH
jgi:hypothetical protein